MISLEELCEGVYEDLNGRVVAVKSDVDSYGVIFECDDWNRSERGRCFELVFDDVAECTVTPSCCDSLIVLDDHPLLWRHNEEHAAVYFSTPPVNPLELMGRLYEEHEQLFGGWRRLSEYLHANSSTLAGGHGLLAQGPKKALERYLATASDSIRCSVVSGHTPQGGYRVMLFDNDHIVFRGVEVVEL